ncbi:shikimate kinase [Nocardia sp. CT2-14]|uniref:Shikimate kinase n=1 Tax=Nocardia aurantiaca TaxID=2675850 RepID=A0A6I3L2D7_9NOCA|nr:shikimate kinase [Nocardia aurantiaca]
MSLVLVGPPGAGKSTIGRKLARELGVELYDTDAGIEERAGRTIPEIFAEDGEPEFRRMEEEVVRDAVLAGHGVVSLGGGSVLSAATRALLRDRTVVYLEISVGEGLRRTGASTNRPLLNGDDPAKKYRELMKIRRPLYREVATVRVRTDGRSPGRVVRMILAKLGLEPIARPEDSATETTTLEPGISSRSRGRRKRRRGGRGRGETDPATTATTTDADSATGSRDGESSPAPPADQGTKRPRRNRRSRRRGGRTAETGSPAATADAAATNTSGDRSVSPAATGETGGESDSARPPAGRGRRRRASRGAGAPVNPAGGGVDSTRSTATNGSSDITGSTPAGQDSAAQRDAARPRGAVAPPGSGRSRRARARRARARAREQEHARSAADSGPGSGSPAAEPGQ